MKAKELNQINAFNTTDEPDNFLINSRFLNQPTFAGDNRPRNDQDVMNHVPNVQNGPNEPDNMPNIAQENVEENNAEPEEIPGEPSMEEKHQEGRNQAYDRMTREEVPKKEIVHKKYLGGRLVEFGDHCWRKEARKTKRGIHVIGTMPLNEIKTHNLVTKEAKIVRGQRRADQEKLDAIIEVLISSKKCIVASFKSTDVIVPKICALQPTKHAIANVSDKVGYTLSLVFLPSKTCYRKLPKDIPDFILDCQCEPCEGPIDEAIDNKIQDYIGTGFIV